MKHVFEETYRVRIYIAGPIEVAKQIIREECMRKGLCVTIEQTHFVYTGGEEVGYVVGLLNYPRFPSSPDDLDERARDLAVKLLDGTYQHSVLVVSDRNSVWISKRD